MPECSTFELEQVEMDFKEEKDIGAVSRLLLFLPKLILITLLVCLILFLADLIYHLVQYYLTGEIAYFLPEASQVMKFARSSTGLLAIGTVLAVIVLFVLALWISFGKKNGILNDEQVNEAEGSKMFQATIEIKDSETPEQVVPLPVNKKASKKIYGKCCDREETKDDRKYRKKNKLNNKRRGYYPDSKPGQRGNVVMFKQKYPSFQGGAYRSIAPRVITAANKIKCSTQNQSGK